jgi:hypothetical protein
MKTLSVTISDLEFKKFGLKVDSLSFTDFIELVRSELVKQNLLKRLESALKSGLSNLTMAEITDEVKAVRRDAKRHT